MKKNYATPDCELLLLNNVDVIMSSVEIDESDDMELPEV